MAVVNYVWNPLEDNIMAEYDDQGNVIVEYTTEPTLHGNVISQYRNGQSHFFHYDGTGNTIAVTDNMATVTDTRAYTAFGETTESTGTTEFPFQFVGQKGYYRDKETGEYSVRARSYEPLIARWKSADPLQFRAGDPNLFQYVVNNPVNLIDPSGMVADENEISNEVKKGRFTVAFKRFENEETGDLGMQMYIQFLPNVFECPPCKAIGMIQAVQTWSKGKFRKYDGDDSPIEEMQTDENKLRGIEQNWHIDHKPKNCKKGDKLCSPFYRDHASNQGSSQDGSTDEVIAHASIIDRPSGPPPAEWFFETCAVCKDNYELYGCVKWGFSTTPKTTVAPHPTSFHNDASPTFNEALRKFRTYYGV